MQQQVGLIYYMGASSLALALFFCDNYVKGEAVFQASNGDPDYKNNILLHTKDPFTKNEENSGPYAVFYTLYNAVANKLVEDDPASSDWESSKTKINNGEIGAMVLGSWCVQQFKDAGDHPDDIGYMPFPITVNGNWLGYQTFESAASYIFQAETG